MTKLTPLLFLVILSISSCDKHSQSTASVKDELRKEIDSLVSSYYQHREFSGSVLVADQGDIIFDKHFGFTSLDSTARIDKESVYEIASISKQFTAMLTMMLKEEGRLDYDDALTKYFPELPYPGITIRHLLTHTSGLAERPFFMWGAQNMDRGKIYHNAIVLQYLEQTQPALSFEPGAKWEYSNVGYFLLALILEQVTGKHYIDLLQQKILSPLGMNHSGIYAEQYKASTMNNYVFGKLYNTKNGHFKSSFGMSWSDSIYGSVGILSNTSDLLRWEHALVSNELVSQQTLDEAFTSYKLSDGTPATYGFGWYIRDNFMLRNVNCGKRMDHNGLWPGYESSIVRYPDHGKTIIILANQAPSAKDRLVEEISAMLFRRD